MSSQLGGAPGLFGVPGGGVDRKRAILVAVQVVFSSLRLTSTATSGRFNKSCHTHKHIKYKKKVLAPNVLKYMYPPCEESAVRPAVAASPNCSPCNTWLAAPLPSRLHSAPGGSAGPQRACSPSAETVVSLHGCICFTIPYIFYNNYRICFQLLRFKTTAVRWDIEIKASQIHWELTTSFMTSWTAGVSGVYSSFPINRGFIPRHTMRDRGLDSRPWIKLLQNGAALRKEQTKGDKCWTKKPD